MKRLLLPLIAALTLPTAVNASDYYLIIKNGTTSSTVPMRSMEACERALDKALVKTNWKYLKKLNSPIGLHGICLKSE